MTNSDSVVEAVNHGEVFTRRWIVDLILDLVGYSPEADLTRTVALEPACGHGAFLLPMVERLLASCELHGRTAADLEGSIIAYDLLHPNVAAARSAVADLLEVHGVEQSLAQKLAHTWVRQGDFLLQSECHRVDVCVGNPPYIRLEEIPAGRSAAYRAACPTMGGRADVFVGFYERGLAALRPNGRLGFICADRWMRNAYGKQLRALVSSNYSVDAVVSMHEVDAFEEQVSAYPAVTVLRAGEQGEALIGDTTRAFNAASARELGKWALSGDREPLHTAGLTAAWLPHWFTTETGWPTGTPERLALVADLEERFPTIEAAGCKVGIGLASGADQVYVTTDKTVAEKSRMLPMVMRQDLRSGSVDWSGHYLVNPWSPAGLISLAKYPRLKAYFEQNWATLAKRNVGKRNPGREYRTIDRVIEGLAAREKLLLADMAERIWPVLERGKFYPHHNLYWITSDEWDLEVLGGLLLSDLAELFVSTYCVRMRGGTLRFQAQYLRRIRVPRFSDISMPDRESLRLAFERRDSATATEIAMRLYRVEAVPT